MATRPAEVIILGGGFAGLAAADVLSRSRTCGVTLIDRNAGSTFSPMLPDLISDRISAEYMEYPLAPYCRRKHVRFQQGEIHSIDATRRTVETSAGTFTADYLLVAVGCMTNYFGNQEAREHSIGLKNIPEGLEIAKRLGQAATGSKSKSPSVLVVGGGYTGFECAGHAARLLHRALRIPYEDLPKYCRIEVLEKSDTVLRNVSPRVRDWACRLLEGYGVNIRTGVTVENLPNSETAILTGGEKVENALVIWTAGVKLDSCCDSINLSRAQGGRLKVDAFLRLENNEQVFAAGDAAGAQPEGKGPLRMSIQFAISGGHRAAENILRSISGKPLKPYDPFDPGYLVPLAPGGAAGIVLGKEVWGAIPLAMHYSLCVFRSRGVKNEVGVLRDFAKKR